MNTAQKINIDLVQQRYHALNEVIPLHPISSEREYERVVQALDALLDVGGAIENTELAALADILSEIISRYEDDHTPTAQLSGVEALKFLMEQHGLTQADLPEIGSQGVVSEVLNQKRALNKTHIEKLSAHFGVSPAVFF